jgi:hypothetical protein
VVVAGVLVVSYVLMYPVFALTFWDIGHYPRHLWTGFGNPHPWRQATVLTYALGGVPVVVTAVVWRRSRARTGMRAAGPRRHREGEDPEPV